MSRAPALSFSLSARVYGGAATSVGQLLIPDNSGFYVPATAANRATYARRTEAVSLVAYGGAAPGGVSLQEAGTADVEVSLLPVGTASWVRCSSTGFAERFTPTNGGTSDVIGWCEADGRLHLQFGTLTETFALVQGLPIVTIPTGVAGKLIALDGAGDIAASAYPVPPTTDGVYQLTRAAGVFSWSLVSAAFDPATLSLTRWRRGSYSGAPWAGTVSAGASVSTNLVTAGSNPAVGAAQNGFTPADYDGSTNNLTDGTVAGAFAVGSFSGWDLIKPDTAAADPGAGSRRNAPAIWDDSGNTFIQLTFHAGGVTLAYVGGSGLTEITAACATGAYSLVQYTYDGTTMSLRVNGGSASTAAVTPRASFTGNLRFGKNYLSACYDGKVLEDAKTNVSTSIATFDSVRTALGTRYGLTL